MGEFYNCSCELYRKYLIMIYIENDIKWSKQLDFDENNGDIVFLKG